MRVVTIGSSPYLLTSRGRLNADILRHLYFKDEYEVVSLVKGHDKTYFVPEETPKGNKYYYTFEMGDRKHKIPIIPLLPDKDDSIVVYELLKLLEPELVITVGDFREFLYMQAVKQFLPHVKWLFVLSNYSIPINENNSSLLQYVDGMLCTSPSTAKSIRDEYQKDVFDTCFPGSFLKETEVDCNAGPFRVMACAKKTPSDNLPMLIECCADLRTKLPNLSLYLHTNLYDDGDHDMELIKERSDPENQFLRFPDKYVSIKDGVSQSELSSEYGQADLFISIPVSSATSMTVFEAMRHGCFPLMSDCGSNADLALLLEDFFDQEYGRNDFLVRCINVMVPGESYISIADPEDLSKKIENAHRKIEKDKGVRARFAQFSREYNPMTFLNKVVEMIEKTMHSSPVMCLETV